MKLSEWCHCEEDAAEAISNSEIEIATHKLAMTRGEGMDEFHNSKLLNKKYA